MGLFTTYDSILGVDIGSSSIKLVELKKHDKGAQLKSYGFTEVEVIDGNFIDNPKFTANLLNKIIKDADMNSKTAVAALPTFAVFSSVLNLSNVSKKDIESSVHWEAKKVIPLPLEEMILDWRIVEEPGKKSTENIKVLLTGAPRTLVKKYIEVFKEAQISLLSLETETFSLVRSLIGNDKTNIMMVEIGNGTTDISIVSNGIPILNRSIDVGGLTITAKMSRDLKLDVARAEQFKYDLAATSVSGADLPKAISETVSPIINEIKYALNLFKSKDSKKVEKIILSGGSAMLMNLTSYLSNVLDMKVLIGDPWARVDYQTDLKPVLDDIGSKLSVAIGLALRGVG